VHETTIHVRWGELDPYQHVNHASYLGYLEHARIEALESIGWGMDRIAGFGCQVVVVRAEVRFRSAASGGDRLTVRTAIADLRGASSRWHQEIRRGDDLVLEAEITAACTTLEGRPTRTPREFQRALADFAAGTA
jgi:acyl-CoA thioester hydrolase